MGELDWLLNNLASTVLGVRSAVILSPDGLPLGRSPGLSEDDADHLAAPASASKATQVPRPAGVSNRSAASISMIVWLKAP